MIADIVEVVFVDHVSDFVQLNAGFLWVNFSFPTDVDYNDTFVCGVDDECHG